MMGMRFVEDMMTHTLVSETLTEYEANKPNDITSGYNTTASNVMVPGGILNAMIKVFLSDRIGLGLSKKGEIYTEVKGDGRGEIVAMLYSPREKKMQACVFQAADPTNRRNLISNGVSKIPYYIAIPCMLHQRIKDAYKELEDAWNEIASDVNASGMPVLRKSAGAGLVIDSIVATNEEFVESVGMIESMGIIPGEIYDYTPELLNGKKGTFFMTEAIPKPKDEDPMAKADTVTYQEEMRNLKEDMYPLVKEYYESLSDADKALVPDEEKLGIYIPTQMFRNIVKIVADGLKNQDMDSQNILLKGPPGVGKSVMAVALAYVFSMPYRFTQSYKTADASEYIGTTVADNGVLKTNVETPFAQTVLHGGVHMDDDNNYAAEGEGTVKNSILIAPYTLKLADGTMAKRHPFSIFMMSANPDMKGARPINEAAKDRYCVIIDMKKLTQNELVRMVKERSHYTDETMLVRMTEAWEKVNEHVIQTGESADLLTPRSLVNWAKQTRIIGNPLEASRYNLLGALCASEQYCEDVYNTVLRPLFGERM